MKFKIGDKVLINPKVKMTENETVLDYHLGQFLAVGMKFELMITVIDGDSCDYGVSVLADIPNYDKGEFIDNIPIDVEWEWDKFLFWADENELLPATELGKALYE